MKKIIVLIVSALCINVTNTQAQTENASAEKKILVYYPFDGVNTTEEIALIDSEIKKMVNVTDSKTEYKAGKTKAQLQVWVTYKANMGENEAVFTAAMLKKLLLQKGYNPHQPREINITNK
ncbi:MAG: hypothetical protein H7331_06820 [Bacteroidia bacterium]|nr:hypothetical protein [Bacteroidia bacterium]